MLSCISSLIVIIQKVEDMPSEEIIQNTFNWLNKIVQCYVVMLQNV